MNKHILLVESHDNLRLLLGGFLSRDFNITGVKDGLEAMSWLNRGHMPAVIIVGARLLKLSSAQFVAALRHSGLHGHIPVMIIGDQTSDPAEERQFRQLGVSDYWGKPFDPLLLQRRLLELTQGIPQPVGN